MLELAACGLSVPGSGGPWRLLGPAPELARYDQIHAERLGGSALATPPAPAGTALGGTYRGLACRLLWWPDSSGPGFCSYLEQFQAAGDAFARGAYVANNQLKSLAGYPGGQSGDADTGDDLAVG